jgi:SAM-dependent methyltransferase
MSQDQRFTYDEVAGLYDRTRPSYPQSLVDDVIDLSGLSPGDRILEIGCGTGQATVDFARRGFSIVCLEPGAAMSQIAREKLERFANVEVVPQTFESWPLETETFSLVISAQSFHWVSPEIRFAKAAAALHRDGTLGVFGNAVVFNDSSLGRMLDGIYSVHAPWLAGPPATRWYAEEGPVQRLFSESGYFATVTRRRYPWSRRYGAAEYVDLLRTHSDHRSLAAEQRELLLRAVCHAIENRGDSIEVCYEAHLYLARRAA